VENVNNKTTGVQNEKEDVDVSEETVIEDQNETTDSANTEEDNLSEEQKEILALKEEVSQLNGRLMRTQADFDNYRRRVKVEQETAAKYRAQSIIEELVPAIDNFERALAVELESDQAKSLLQGMEMVYRQLIEAITKEGVAEINPVGEAFDPNFHQAVMQVESDEHEANTVIEVLQKGYQLKDRVIRPAMVKVNA
jgi:molecular chaperone GrpE